MNTASISTPNGYFTAILGLSLLALAAPACVAGADEDGEPGAPSGVASVDSDDPGLDNAAHAGDDLAIKPAPVRPAVLPGVTVGDEMPVKSAHRPRSLPGYGPVAWTVSLSANPPSLWPTQYTTLTATANADVGPTPYYLRIQDTTTGVFLASCGAGTTCSIPVTQPLEGYGSYLAYVEDFYGSNVQATSPVQFVEYYYADLRLSASPTTVTVGASTTLTATTARDIGPSPFYTHIVDTTTGVLLARCGAGTTCSVQATQAAASTHAYRAYLSPFSVTFPPAGVQETTPTSYVTWANTGLSVSLGAPVVSGSTETFTATASIDVGPTPYYIEIFNEESGARLAVCGSGTTCSAQVSSFPSADHLVAFLSGYSSDLPPTNTQASSNVAGVVLVVP